MNNFSVFLCLVSVALVVKDAAAQAQNDGVYIVYTGAAASSSTGFGPDHILSSSFLESKRDRVIHTYKKSFSGFAARLSEEEARSIAQRPEVVSVFPDPILQLHTTRSWDFLNAQSKVFKPPTHQTGSGNSKSHSPSGEDTIIGIVDTGIWPEAKSFSDEGLGPIPKRWKGTCSNGPDFSSALCNRKLIGANNYVLDDNFSSPRDRVGHGTHVAGIAAGRVVQGASYNGLANGTARGGSPGSRIAVYRACGPQGCPGSSILKAMDDAIADGVDVLSLSIGLSPLINFSTDPTAIGAFHAIEKDVIVVCASGNDGPKPSSVLNPAPWILTVGATTIDRFFESDVVLGGNRVIKGGGVHFAEHLRKTPVYPLIRGISARTRETTKHNASNCFPGSLDRKKVEGKIVLCESNDEEQHRRRDRVAEVMSRGGIGMIYVNQYGQLVGSVYSAFPVVLVTTEDGKKIRSYIKSNRHTVATILPTEVVSKHKPAPSVAYISGRGPIYDNDYLIKPDVAAPGVDILSTWPSNATNEAFFLQSGTSMACPHVSGIAALVKSHYPSWSHSAIKSAIMTTAIQTNNLKAPITNHLGNPATPDEYGAGEATLFGPLQPGLVYETEISDYLLFLCNMGYDVDQIKLIPKHLPANFSCPSDAKEDLISNMNYPSIAIARFNDSKRKKVKRTVTNVGSEEESVYIASVEMSTDDLKVQVNPTKLHFTKKKKKLSYEVTFKHQNSSSSLSGLAYGSITWTNEKYTVRIPFVVRE
ncbi:OLC1v1018294C1 [Oldenlandia corymbosa var. corymbosa]|uniref:OLC1v1018294C1 n=1 Tax=Oldenlandia corymbosa var. corymbosa TaxID=529605 RepID=A0AAV1EBB4_OLDCO|nr:OLC1v1018294C1 [Oldenlandia corymbosa var. corymbosa]